MIRIAHFVRDEKFTDSAYKQFEAIKPKSSVYYIVSESHTLRYIREAKVQFVSNKTILSKMFVNDLGEFDLVIFHSLNREHIKIAAKISKRKVRAKMIWIGMGYDYYDLIYPDKNLLLLEKTSKYISSLEENEFSISLKRHIKSIIKHDVRLKKEKIQAIQNIDYFSPVLPNEYELVRRAVTGNIMPGQIRWNYGINSKLVDNTNAPLVNKKGIDMLVGNSGYPTNNHLEAFDLLQSTDDQRGKIICPLNYGDEGYIEMVVDKGGVIFGDSFIPILEFMHYPKYIERIQACSVAVMNHVRQQAGGNVLAMLHMGATVFLREENPMYKFYKSQGATIYSVQELIQDSKLIKYRLTDREIKDNRAILRANFSSAANLEKTSQLIDLAQ
jgi:hypothetical protein